MEYISRVQILASKLKAAGEPLTENLIASKNAIIGISPGVHRQIANTNYSSNKSFG